MYRLNDLCCLWDVRRQGNKMNNTRLIAVLFMAITTTISSVAAKVPEVLAYENILKQDMSKKVRMQDGLPVLPALVKGASIPVNPPQLAVANFNVVGVLSVNGATTAWLINKENKIARVTEGIVIDGKVIGKITSYGVHYSEQGGSSGGFMPIMTASISERDISFETRDIKSENDSGMNK